MYIRVRGEIPERDIAVHALVMGDGLDHACRVRVQTLARTNLTDAACMPDLTVEDYTSLRNKHRGLRTLKRPAERRIGPMLISLGIRFESGYDFGGMFEFVDTDEIQFRLVNSRQTIRPIRTQTSNLEDNNSDFKDQL